VCFPLRSRAMAQFGRDDDTRAPPKRARLTSRPDLYQSITDQIIAALEKGVAPWHRPWSAGHPAGTITRPLRHNGVPYRGINVFLLWLAAHSKGYSAPFWMTYRQAQELGGYVCKGEKVTGIVYASTFTRTG